MSDRNIKNSLLDRKDDVLDLTMKQKLAHMREELICQKEQVKEIKDLIKTEIETHYESDLWELSPKELNQEMGKLLSFLNQDIDCLSLQKITSHRKLIGGCIVFIKKTVKRIIRPVLELYFGRQRRFNESAVRFQLASYIRFRRMEQKLEGIEKIVTEIEEQQDTLLDAIRSLSERPGKNGPKR